MGSIYERARFTIAASAAVNSTEGLFKVRESLTLVEIPYKDQTAKRGGADLVFAYIEPDMEKCLSSSPLNQRAWVMQEYYLSRRTVHCTKFGLVWSCDNGKRPQTRYMQSEFGASWEAVFEDDWKTLVQNYTRRELTYKSDKLVALNGLASRFVQRNSEKNLVTSLGYGWETSRMICCGTVKGSLREMWEMAYRLGVGLRHLVRFLSRSRFLKTPKCSMLNSAIARLRTLHGRQSDTTQALSCT